MIDKDHPFKGLNPRIPMIIPSRGVGLLISGLGYGWQGVKEPMPVVARRYSQQHRSFHLVFQIFAPCQQDVMLLYCHRHVSALSTFCSQKKTHCSKNMGYTVLLSVKISISERCRTLVTEPG